MENIPNLREQDKPHPLDAVARTAEGVAMPTREEIAEALKRAAINDRAGALACAFGLLSSRFKQEFINSAEKFDNLATQVEAMRCSNLFPKRGNYGPKKKGMD